MPVDWNQPLEGCRRFVWGSRELIVAVRPGEVRVLASGGADPFSEEHVDGEPCDEPEGMLRFGTRPGSPITLSVRAADKSVIVRPAEPLAVLGGASTVVYVSTPAWIGLRQGGPPFFEVPVHRPSNTWFGETTQQGELAYATRSRARTDLAALKLRPGRVHTRITLHNGLADPWEVVRMKVPCPHLPLFAVGEGLWTASLRIARTSDGEIDMTLENGPPNELGKASRLADPRDPGTPKLLVRALGTLRLT
ncbi:MAG: hypothetical protein KC656_13410 [Myxococcales bacterium]|nr:hypothetical protein [Myxococcales bacterium]